LTIAKCCYLSIKHSGGGVYQVKCDTSGEPMNCDLFSVGHVGTHRGCYAATCLGSRLNNVVSVKSSPLSRSKNPRDHWPREWVGPTAI